MSGKRILLLAVAGSLSALALLAIGILLFGRFGETEGRILATTALIAGCGLLALPSGILLDQARLLPLALAGLVLAAAGLALNVTAVWTSDAPEALGKSIATIAAFAGASAQVSALAARRRESDPRSVRRLFALSVVLAPLLAAMVAAAAWAEIDSQGYFRALGALAVLDVLVVALQPILGLSRPAARVYRLRVVVEPDEAAELGIEASDFAAAAAKAIRHLERNGRRVLRLERLAQSDERRLGATATSREARRHALR